MNLFRLFGYEITAQRLVDVEDLVEPAGGQLNPSPKIVDALANSLATAEKGQRLIKVALRVDTAPGSRTSPMREAAIDFAFAQTATVGRAALALATKLSRSMDRRSNDCLFLVAAYRKSANSPFRRVAIWMFPQDDAFRFSPGQQDIQFLTDIFSRTSGLRKLALFEGQNTASNFLQADVLDYQLGRRGDVADFWIERFLDANLAMLPATGTRILADALKKAANVDDLTPEERDQLNTAAIALQTTPQTHWSLTEVAERFLSGRAAEVFLASPSTDEQRTTVFEVDKSTYQRTLARRSFRLPDGVFVSAPLEQVSSDPEADAVVRLAPDEDAKGAQERLRIEADVLEDRLTSRDAR